MVAMTLFHADKYGRLASKDEAFASLCRSTCQFLSYSTFALVLLTNQDLIAPTDANHHDWCLRLKLKTFLKRRKIQKTGPLYIFPNI